MKVIHCMDVYRKDTVDCDPPPMPSNVRFGKLTEAEVLERGHLPADVHRRQNERLIRFGASYCYGAYIDDDLASFAWLLQPAAMRRDVPHLLTGGSGEAELTGTETIPRHRGRWLYKYVAFGVFSAARDLSIHSVLFKMRPNGRPPKSRFAKYDARFVGRTYFAYLPGMGDPIAWPRRFA